MIHPFEDPIVIAGQGTIGLELAEQVPAAATVLIPVGGGGLASGIAYCAARREAGRAHRRRAGGQVGLHRSRTASS
jgi:threonine dehydratase